MSGVSKATARPTRAEPHTRKAVLNVEVGHLLKTHSLLIAVQFAANHDCEFDVSDALAVIRDRVGDSVVRLDKATVLP